VRVLVTGASGFIGSNLCANLARRQEALSVLRFDVETPAEALAGLARQADFVVHLAGVNRPPDAAEFETGNADWTRRLLDLLRARPKGVPFMLASSAQAALDNPYGRSKRAAEEAVFDYARDTGAPAHIFRFPGVFGKWCRPYYNSVVATFCHQAARGEPMRVDDPDKKLELLYIDDLVDTLTRMLIGDEACRPDASGFCRASPVHTVTLGVLADTLRGFASARVACALTGDRSDPFTRKLYATFLSYLPEGEFAVSAVRHADARGDFAELIKSPHFGQVSVSRTKPGVTRGQHWHNTKNEKFIVLSGYGLVRFRKLSTDQPFEYAVSGERMTVCRNVL